MRVGRALSLILAGILLCAHTAKAAEPEKQGKKLDKELRKITEVAAVMEGRRVVNRVMADFFGVTRKLLVEQRRQTNFTYGQIFGVHEIVLLSGQPFAAIAQDIQQGRSFLQLAGEHGIELKEMVRDAREFNQALKAEFDRQAGKEGDGSPTESAELYDPTLDTLGVDTAGLTQADLVRIDRRLQDRQAGIRDSSSGGAALGGSGTAGTSSTRGRGIGSGPSSSAGRGRR